jgi:hypothetical protein
MIIIMAIMEMTDGNLEQLFEYNNEKQFIKYITQYSHNNSDHLTAFNIYTKLYSQNKMKYLNFNMFNKIKNYISNLTKYAQSIKTKDYDYMNDKYFMISIEPFHKISKNIIYILSKSYEYNLIQNNKTVNFINQSTAKFKFAKCTKHDDKIKTAICHTLINTFGKKIFLGITSY